MNSLKAFLKASRNRIPAIDTSQGSDKTAEKQAFI